jgi:hypothetical protein
MAKFQLQPGEQVLKQDRSSYLKNRFNLVQGVAVLTDRRFVHTNRMRAIAVGGLFGALSKGRVDIDLPLGAIASFTRDLHGRKRTVLKVTTGDGQEHRLMPRSFEEWLGAFAEALATHHHTKLVEHQPGFWAAERV